MLNPYHLLHRTHYNHHIKESTFQSYVNDMDEDTDEDESNNSIVHNPFDETSSENLVMEVSESECNIVNETSSQSDSSDVPTNFISELNDEDHIKPSANVKDASYFDIFECRRNF